MLHSSVIFNTYLTNNNFIKNSYLMVEFFFILSGFVIAYNYQNKISDILSLFHFQVKRFLRLYPLHFLTLFLFLGFDTLEYFKEIIFNDIGLSESFQERTLNSFIHNLFLTHNIFLNYNSWNVPSWSISAEFYTYLLFGAFLLFSKKFNISIVLISILIIVLSFIYLLNHNFTPQYGLFRCIYGFFLGVIIFNIYKIYKIKINKYFSYIIFLISLICIYFSNNELSIGLNILMPFIFSALILSLLLSDNDNFLIKLLSIKILVYLGSISYGIYMFHYFFWKIYSIFTDKILNININIIQNNFSFFINLFVVIGLIKIIYISHLSYKYFEKPISSVKKN